MLPEEFWAMQNLDHLDFDGIHTMRFTNVELCKLANFQYLNQLAIILYDLPDIEILSHCLTKLSINNCPTNSMNLVTLFGNMEKLSELRIVESSVQSIESVTIFNTNSGSTHLSSLEMLEVLACGSLERIEADAFAILMVLHISGCKKLKHIKGLEHLQQLEELSINSGDMEELVSTGGPISSAWMKSLTINGFSQLISTCSDSGTFPSLNRFVLHFCLKLEKLPLELINENRTIRDGRIVGSQEWWDGLSWQDDLFESFLLPLFMAQSVGIDFHAAAAKKNVNSSIENL